MEQLLYMELLASITDSYRLPNDMDFSLLVKVKR